MKQALFIGVFSLLVLAPLGCAQAQASKRIVDTKALERSSARTSSKDPSTNGRKAQGPVSDTAAANVTAKNPPTSQKATGSPELSGALAGPALEAQKNYDAGVASYNAGKLDEAIDSLKEANRLSPDDPETHYMLGLAYSKSKAYKEAADSFKLATRSKPDWAEAHFKLGVMSYVLGRRAQSLEEHKKLQELDSTLAKALYRIIREDASLTDAVETAKTETPPSSTKRVRVVPVSTSAMTAKTDRSKSTPVEPQAPIRTNSTSRTSTSSPEATVPATLKAINEVEPLNNTAAPIPDTVLTRIYKIGAGDVLDIRLLNSATNQSTLYTVLDSGLIDFPMAGGPIAVAGLTTEEIQERIAAELKRRAVDEGAQVSVGVREYASHTVIITGLVATPGIRVLRREAVPLYVLLAEVQPRLDAGRVSITRAGAGGLVIDLSNSAALNFIVRPGDVINITARPQEFYYIAGRINNPGQKVFQPGITLLQAILAAGGFASQQSDISSLWSSGRNSSIELSREGADGRLVTTKFNLKEIKSGKIQDPKLQPGDRIEVVH